MATDNVPNWNAEDGVFLERLASAEPNATEALRLVPRRGDRGDNRKVKIATPTLGPTALGRELKMGNSEP